MESPLPCPFEGIIPDVEDPIRYATEMKGPVLAIDFITNDVEKLLRRVVSTREAATLPYPAKTKSKEVVQIARTSGALPPLDESLNFLPEATFDLSNLMLALARDPLGTELGNYLCTEILEEVFSREKEAKEGEVMKYYLREYRFRDASEFVEQMKAYALRHPQDSAWAIASLVTSGHPQEAVTLLDMLCTLIGCEPPSTQFPSLMRPTSISLKYAGMSRAASAWERSAVDVRRHTTRITNFSQCNGWKENDVRIFQIPSLTLSGLDEVPERTDPRVGPREEWLIGHISIGLNSAPGHERVFFVPPPVAMERFSSVDKYLPPLPSNPTIDIDMIDQVESGERDQINFWRTKRGQKHSSGKVITSAAAEAQIHHGARMLSSVGGRVLRVNVNSDLPQEILLGKVPPGILKACAGTAMATLKYFTSLVNPEMLPHDPYKDMDYDLASKHLGPHFDVQSYPYDPNCTTWGISSLFLSRTLRIISPEIIISYGDEVTTSFESDVLVQVWNEVPSSFLDNYQNNQTTMETISKSPASHIHLPRESRTTVRKYSQGVPRIVSYGPNPLDLACCIPQVHYGALRYIPALRVPRGLMAFLVECRINIAHRLAAKDALDRVPQADDRKGRIEQLKELGRRIKDMVEACGLGEMEEKARANLIATERAYYFLRDLGNKAKGMESNAGYTVPSRDNGESTIGEAYSPQRQQQYEFIVESEEDRALRGLNPLRLTPGGLPWTNAKVHSWFIGMEIDTSMLRSAIGLGTTPEGYQRRAAFIQKNAQWLGTFQHDQRQKRLATEAADDCRAKTELVERFGPLCDALMEETRPHPSTWVDTPHAAFCTACNHHVYAIHKNDEHRCGSLSHPITSIVFKPQFRNLFYSHDLFDDEGVKELLGDDLLADMISNCGFTIESAWDIIPDDLFALHGHSKNPAMNLPIWVLETTSAEFKLTMALDRVLRQACSMLAYNVDAPEDGLWESTVDRSLVPTAQEAVSQQQPFLLRICRFCRHTIVSNTPKPNHSCKRACNCNLNWSRIGRVEEHPNCSGPNQMTLCARKYFQEYSIKSIWKLPYTISRWLWFQQRVMESPFDVDLAQYKVGLSNYFGGAQ
ncbi:hypothetical protein FRB91_010197 [Serendipita sp. 411]|nr:hypothetical protein FRB91_010197 [Serendipita sp. 411]